MVCTNYCSVSICHDPKAAVVQNGNSIKTKFSFELGAKVPLFAKGAGADVGVKFGYSIEENNDFGRLSATLNAEGTAEVPALHATLSGSGRVEVNGFGTR